MADKNFTMHRYNGTSFDTLYPETTIEQVDNLQTSLDSKVNKNNDITGDTKAKITYDSKGLVTGGEDLAASDIPSLQLTKISDITATAAEVNYTAGVTSAIQTQLNGKATIAYSALEPVGQVEGDFWFDIVGDFNITNNLTNCSKVSGPTVIIEGGTATLTYTANAGYNLPDSVTVTGATSNWTKSTGTLLLSNPTDNISITISAEIQTFTITNNLTYCTKTSGADIITYGTSETLVFSANEHYNLPASITVTGATSNWNQATGTVVLSNPTANVNVTITAEPQTFTITNNLTNCSKSSGPDNISYGSTATLVYTATGSATLPANITVTGASYTWSQNTGTIVLSNPTGNVTIAIKCLASLIGKWLLNSNPPASASSAHAYSINYTIPDDPVGATFNSFYAPFNVYKDSDGTVNYFAYYSTYNLYFGWDPSRNTYGYRAPSGSWSTLYYCYITITGGSDINNQTLIEWMNNNAVKQ